MTYSDNFAYFLEIPDAEQVRFAFLMSFSKDWMIYFWLRLSKKFRFVSEHTCISPCLFILIRKSLRSSTVTCCLSLRSVFTSFVLHLSPHWPFLLYSMWTHFWFLPLKKQWWFLLSLLRWPDWFFQEWLRGITTHIQSLEYKVMTI